MIEFIQQYLTDEEWEKLCNSCYRMRYQEDGYQEIPASPEPRKRGKKHD